MSVGIIKDIWQWDSERITQIVRACIRLGQHPELWKTVKGVVIPKPGKPDYSKVRAYRVRVLGYANLNNLTGRWAAVLACFKIKMRTKIKSK